MLYEVPYDAFRLFSLSLASNSNPYSIQYTMFDFFPCQGPRSSGASSVLGSRQEERVSLTLPGFDDDDGDDDEKISENEVECSLRTNARG